MTGKLDPREVRRLTSREVSRILGSVIGGLVTSRFLEPGQVRELVRSIADSPEVWSLADEAKRMSVREAVVTARSMQGEGDPAELVAARVLGALASGLSGWCGKRSVRTAFAWWANTDAAWITLT